MCFLVFGTEKKRVERLGSRQISEKMCVLLSDGCLGLFIALGHFSRWQPIMGCQP